MQQHFAIALTVECNLNMNAQVQSIYAAIQKHFHIPRAPIRLAIEIFKPLAQIGDITEVVDGRWLKKGAYLVLIWLFKAFQSQEYAPMSENITTTFEFPASANRDALSELLREGAQQMLATAIEAEVEAWIAGHAHLRDEAGHRQVIRNGHLQPRNLTTGLGRIEVEQPRVHDRRTAEEREKFNSRILPPHLRKTKSIEELISWL